MYTAYLDAFAKATDPQNPAQAWITPYTAPAAADTHQFVLFIKPEATAVHDGVKLDAVLDLVLGHLEDFGVTLHAARALPAAYLDTHAIMDNHYGVINRISKQGVEALTDDARAKLKILFADDLAAGAEVLGGHQFLAKQPEISSLALSALNDNVGTTKLGGGSYAMRLNLLGHIYILLNPFHAYQLVPYTTPGRAILIIEGRSTRDWADLRVKLTGATNPANAAPGSIRAALLANKDTLGLKDVNQGMNGIHLSAGPLEGMVELKRFFSDPEAGRDLAWSDLAFGQALATKHLDAAALAQNPDLERDGKAVSAFDLTEERNASDALELLV
jgi:hypothetical protein